MAQAMIDNLQELHPCDFCTKICKSTTGLMSHMNKMHPLDSPSGLTCYTCNKLFTNRDLIENHYKTVRHQLECKKIKALEQVEITNPEAEIRKYRKNLLEITHFKVPEYKPRRWSSEETKKTPLENTETLKDPRLLKRKRPTHTDIQQEKTRKLCEEPQLTASSIHQSTTDTQNMQNILENPQESTTDMEGVILHVTESELNLFPDIPESPKDDRKIEDCNNEQEKRRVYLNNNWQVKDSIGNPAFEGLIEENSNIDWLTFIAENINY